MKAKNRLLRAAVWHLREKPKRNEFTYNVYYLAHRLKSQATEKPALLSYDRFNALSLYKKDLGNRDNSSWLSWVEAQFKEKGITVKETDDIEVITHPRLFGYNFNPITYWLLVDKSEQLQAVLCEVHNTFGANHNYLLFHEDGRNISKQDRFTAPKKLFVSPFNTMDGYYTFSFDRTPKKFSSTIFYYVGDDAVVKTAVSGTYHSLTSLGILVVLFKYPLMTLLVIGRIHWQAVKLYFKKVTPRLDQNPKSDQSGTTTGTIEKTN